MASPPVEIEWHIDAPTEIDRGSTVARVAFASLRADFASFLAHEPAARLGEDPEEVHDMRVATRRMRAAASLFAGALPEQFGSFRRELKWVAQTLGDVRDLDVQLEQVEEWTGHLDAKDAGALQPITEKLNDRRTEARGRLLDVLDSQRYSRLAEAMTDALQQEPSPTTAGGKSITAVAPDLIGRARRKVRKVGDRISRRSTPEDFHTLRIRCKRLRYALEFHTSIYPHASKRMIKRLVEVQDLLGLHQDAQVAIAHLRSLLEEPMGSPPHRAAFVLRRVTEQYERRASDLRARFPKVYGGILGKPWKALKREMRT